MKRIACILTLVGLCLQAGAQLSRYSTKFTLSRRNFVDSIAISYEHGQVLVPVFINNQCYRFLLDTGSSQAVVYADRPLPDCKPVGVITSHDAVGHKATINKVQLPPMRIGSVVYTGCEATVQPRAVKDEKVDGIIGFDLVCKGLQMKIDVANHLLVLTDLKKFFDDERGFETRYKLNYHVPYVIVSPFPGYSEQALFDTGSRNLYVMNKQHFDEAEQKQPVVVSTQVEGRTEGRHIMGHQGPEPLGEVVFLNLSHFTFGGCVLRNLRAITSHGGSHVGAPLLRYGAVIFNPRRNRLKFQPYSADKTITVGNRHDPLRFVVDQGKMVVGLVWEHGPAYQVGFRVGDVVLRRYPDGTYVLRDVEGREKEIKWP